MAKQPKNLQSDTDDMATDWPVIDSYTTEDGFLVKVYRAAYAFSAVNTITARPRTITL